jgi:outer membrane biosynthesis protein TonB
MEAPKMMPSVVPARLQFQCGHAALVTLPRVKGETATQRNVRVAREKSAALVRQCDFCGPVNGSNHVDIVELAEALNGTNHVSDVVEDMETPSVDEVLEELIEDVVVSVPEFITDALVPEVRVPDPEVPEPLVPELVIVEVDEIEEVDEVEPEAQPSSEPKPAPKRRRANAVATEPKPARTRRRTSPVATPEPAPKPRAKRQPARSARPVARGQQFLVTYRLERVLRANTVRDVLRQAASFGATEVVAITRED